VHDYCVVVYYGHDSRYKLPLNYLVEFNSINFICAQASMASMAEMAEMAPSKIMIITRISETCTNYTHLSLKRRAASTIG